MRREFCLAHTVRYDECNCDGVLTPRAFLQYMQDIAARDAADAQLEGDGFWVVKRTVIEFAAPIPVHTRLEMKTFGLGFTRITAQRGYEARFADQPGGEAIIAARTLWVYVDPRGRPARLPERTAQIWLPGETLAPQPEAAFPPLPTSEPELADRVVHFSHVDLARHLNNASAVEMLDDAAWEACAQAGILPDTASFAIRHYDIEYVDSPRYGAELAIQTWFEPLPIAGQEFTRVQQITRADKVMVRARSRWFSTVL
jgi:acyl-CoA thioesterase FadM